MNTVRTVDGVRGALAEHRIAGRRIGLIPTMGSLHDGHLSLLRRAREECDHVVMSLFVNPAQFDEARDLAAYPRDEDADIALATAAGVDTVFAPAASEMYPDGFATTIHVGGVTETLEGAERGPAHFDGVATVVAKLFNIVQPHVAYFGQKDAQQAIVIRRLVRDLNLPVRIEVCPIVREADGLAMSSRNVRLDPDARFRAAALRRALSAAAGLRAGGERNPVPIIDAGRAELERAGITPEYFALVDPSSLAPVAGALDGGPVLALVAARVGDVRLIDNAHLPAPDPDHGDS